MRATGDTGRDRENIIGDTIICASANVGEEKSMYLEVHASQHSQ